MSDEFFDQVGKEAEKTRLSLCPEIVKDWQPDGSGTRQCRLVLTNQESEAQCAHCFSKIRLCDCEQKRFDKDACDRRHCPRLSRLSE